MFRPSLSPHKAQKYELTEVGSSKGAEIPNMDSEWSGFRTIGECSCGWNRLLDASERRLMGSNSSEGIPKVSLSSVRAGVDGPESKDWESPNTPVLKLRRAFLSLSPLPGTSSSLSESITMTSLDAAFKLVDRTLGANSCRVLTLARFIASALEKKSSSVRFEGCSLRFFAADGPM